MTITEFDTLTDRAAWSMADRVLHHAKAVDRPYTRDNDLVAAWIGERGMFVNGAIVLSPPDDGHDVLDRVTAVTPDSTTATLVSPFATPALAEHGWVLVGPPPLMARMPGAAQ